MGRTVTHLFLIAATLPCVAQTVDTRVPESARAQVGVTVRYDSAYRSLEYPGGDVASDRGVCTDVIVRALRDANSMDLQVLVHEDMKANFGAYPDNWGLRAPDKNIDHRRVPNLRRYFERRGYAVPVTGDPSNYLPGDIVTCVVPPHLDHIMIVSDRTSKEGVPLVIHNIGAGTREEDRLFEFELTGHFRIPGSDSEDPATDQRDNEAQSQKLSGTEKDQK